MAEKKVNPRLAEALKAAMPKPNPKRTEKMLLAFTEEEKARLLAYAKEVEEPPATAARNLILGALTALGREA